jgi:hypothetical protein
LNWQAVIRFVVDHSQFVRVAPCASSTLLGEQSSESLVDVERQEPMGEMWFFFLEKASAGSTKGMIPCLNVVCF